MRAFLAIRDPGSRELLERVLVSRGWQTIVGSHADALAAAQGVSLVAVEELPDGSGSDLCRSIRGLNTTASPYLLGLLAEPEQAAIRRLAQAKVDDVLVGPTEQARVEVRVALAEARIGIPEVPSSPTRPGNSRLLGEIEHEFHVQQAFLEGLIEGAPEGVVILDATDRIVRINSEFSRIFGYSLEDAQGRILNDLIVPEGLLDEGVAMDVSVRRGEQIVVETVRRHRDGGLINVSVLAKHIDVNGPVGAFGIYRDITERKTQEAALRASEERYRALFYQSPMGVLLCDRDLLITHCNESLSRIVGASSESLIGAHLVSLRDRRLLPGLRAALRGTPAFYEGPFRARSGEQRHVSIQYAPLRDDQGTVVGGMGVLEDISDRIRSERELRAQAAELERVNVSLHEQTLELELAMQARSRLYTSINHELRTPISAILLYQELLIEGSLGPLVEDQRRALENSHTATRHLLELVRDILDLSKLEAGKVTVQPSEISLRSLLGELHASVAPLTERYGSRLSISVDDDADRIVTDPQRLRQILLNFVSNAAKYGRQNPIEIRCSRNDGGELIIDVIDQGIGIAADNLKQIFEDFVQLDSGHEEGTGLGLAISRRLADLLETRLEVESTLGRGSTFRLIFSREPAAVEAGKGETGA